MQSDNARATQARAEIVAALVRLKLAAPGQPLDMTPLAGGVSSDIWRIDLASGAICVKRALPRLKVAALWEAPIERNAFEYAWFQTVGARFPTLVPKLIGRDETVSLFAMNYLDPAAFPVWKRELAEGRVDPDFARSVGDALGGIHASTADDAALAKRFATDASFHALRLEPYLIATAGKHADVADALRTLAMTTAATRRVLVHGDVSPKNILCGPGGPVILDAECAWYGDPAFDLAFCLNHLLLKCLWVPASKGELLASFGALTNAYLDRVTWEPRAALEARAAALLPGLFLARIDGKSPVEYLTNERDHERVRRVAKSLMLAPVARLASIALAWEEELSR